MLSINPSHLFQRSGLQICWIAMIYSRVFQDLTPSQVTHRLSGQLLNAEANFAAVLMWRASFNIIRHFFFLALADGCRHIISFITHLDPSTVKLKDHFYDFNCHVLHTHGWNCDLLPENEHHGDVEQCNVFRFYFVSSFNRREVEKQLSLWDKNKGLQ